MRGLTGALIATSLVLAAVFIPVSFLGGDYRFALPAVCHYHCRFGVDIDCGRFDAEPGDVCALAASFRTL